MIARNGAGRLFPTVSAVQKHCLSHTLSYCITAWERLSMTLIDFLRGFGFCGVFVRCENLFSARYALVYALIRVLLRYISDEQEKKHTAERS